MKKILIIEEQFSSRELLIKSLSKKDIQLFAVESSARALKFLKEISFDLIFSDLKGINDLNRLKKLPSNAILIYLSKIDESQTIQAEGILEQPFTEQKINAIFNDLTKNSQTVIAESPKIKQVINGLEKIALSHSNVFICGESGTGKEVIANMIHNLSKRKSRSFIRVNCAALPDTLIESEFFGHEKGSFTGALQKRIGRFELANKGTFLLDEISEIPAVLQAKLLRVAQEQEFERVGGTESLKVDVRLISTSNCDMKEAIKQGKFREDLYYRLNVIPIYLPPLRERVEDIIPLSNYFLKEICNNNHLPPKNLSSEAKEKLLSYHWPGNIRELRNIIEYSVVMNQSDQIDNNHILIEPHIGKSMSINYTTTNLKDLEREHILRILEKCKNNRTHTAKALGISIRTLRNKLKLYQ